MADGKVKGIMKKNRSACSAGNHLRVDEPSTNKGTRNPAKGRSKGEWRAEEHVIPFKTIRTRAVRPVHKHCARVRHDLKRRKDESDLLAYIEMNKRTTCWRWFPVWTIPTMRAWHSWADSHYPELAVGHVYSPGVIWLFPQTSNCLCTRVTRFIWFRLPSTVCFALDMRHSLTIWSLVKLQLTVIPNLLSSLLLVVVCERWISWNSYV
jgi:hypothetical protein